MKYRKDIIIILIFVVTAAILLSLFAASPFKLSDHDGAGGCFWGTVARNYQRYGLIATKFAMIQNSGELLPSQYRIYTHHPILSPIIIYISLQIFGVNEWSVRLPFILCALMVLATSYLIARQVWNRRTAVLSSIAMLIMPVYLHYSRVPDMVSIALFFSLLSVYFYCRWLKQNKHLYLIWLSLALALAFSSSWETYHLIPAFIAHNLLFAKNKRFCILILAIGIICISIYMLHTFILGGFKAIHENLRWAIAYRSGLKDIATNSHFLMAYVKGMSRWIWLIFTPIIITSPILLLLSYCKPSMRRKIPGDSLLLLFLISGATQCAVSLNLCFYHPQRLYYLIPFFAFSSALAINTTYEYHLKTTVRKVVFSAIAVILAIFNILYFSYPVFFLLHQNDGRLSFILDRPKFPPCGQYYTNQPNEFSELKEYLSKEGPNNIYVCNHWNPCLQFYVDNNVQYEYFTLAKLKKLTAINIHNDKKIFFLFILRKYIRGKSEKLLLDYLENNTEYVRSFNKGKFILFRVK